MKKFYKIVIILFVMFFLSWALLAQTKNEKKIDFENYISAVKEKVPTVTEQKLLLESKRIAVKSEKGSDDIVLSLSSDYKYIESDTDENQYSKGIYSKGSVSKKITETGTDVTGSLSYNSVDTQRLNNFGETEDSKLYSPSATLSLRQPVLKNFLGKVDRYAQRDVKNQYEIQKINSQINIDSIIDYYTILYCKWIYNLKEINLRKQYVSNASRVYSQTARKRKSGLVENDDLQKAYISLLANRSNLEEAELSLKTIENEINSLIALEQRKPEVKYFDELYEQSFKADITYIKFKDTKNYALMNMTLKSLVDYSEVSSNEALPDFDIIASITRKDSDEVNSDSWDFDKTEYSLGFEFTYKFGNNSSEAKYEKALNELEIYKISIKETEIKYNTDLYNLIENISRTKKMIKFYEQKLRALRSQLATERRKYSQARITLSNMINTIDSISSTQTALNNMKLGLIGLYLDYNSMVKK